MSSEIGSHYKVVLGRSNNCREGTQSKTRPSEKNEKPLLKPESLSMKLSTMNFSNAINRERTIDFSMSTCLLAFYSNMIKLLQNMGAFGFN